MHTRRTLRAASLIASLSLLCAIASLARASDPGPGCRPLQPAVAHHGGGVPIDPQPGSAPIPCSMPTGFAGGESAIAVDNQGSVFYAPAVPSEGGVQTQLFAGPDGGFAKTTDEGATWSFVEPIATSLGAPHVPGGGWSQIDHKFYMDRETGRLWWATPNFGPESIFWTDDGAHWGTSALPVGFAAEWTQITTATPRISTVTNYPKVVYACGEYDSVGRHGDVCQKSLDGGLTWIVAGQGFFGAPFAAQHAECNGQTEHPNFSPWAAPVSQGRIYELLLCGTSTFLMRSDDEGATWPVVAQFPDQIVNHAELRTDAADNFYVAYDEPGGLYMRTSRDFGQTWSARINVFAPGVASLKKHFGFDVAEPGHVAFSYLGHTNARAGYDGYITETTNALDSDPAFYSGIVNNLAEPPLDFGGAGCCNGLGLDYVSVAIAPDGTAWGSFWDACGLDLPADQANPACPAYRNPPNVTTYGYTDFAGRLPLPR